MTEDERIKKYLWDFFIIAQMDILSSTPKDYQQFNEFLQGKHKSPPFNEKSVAYEVCKLCGKL